jgi:hypothetical protein
VVARQLRGRLIVRAAAHALSVGLQREELGSRALAYQSCFGAASGGEKPPNPEHTDGSKELYDLRADPYQLNSLHADPTYYGSDLG